MRALRKHLPLRCGWRWDCLLVIVGRNWLEDRFSKCVIAEDLTLQVLVNRVSTSRVRQCLLERLLVLYSPLWRSCLRWLRCLGGGLGPGRRSCAETTIVSLARAYSRSLLELLMRGASSVGVLLLICLLLSLLSLLSGL